MKKMKKTLAEHAEHDDELIPAVKRGDRYLDLVDNSLIDYEPNEYGPFAWEEIFFISKKQFDL